MAENMLWSKFSGLGGIVRRLPKVVLRALGAAVAAFLDTFTRPEAAEPGSVADLAAFGVRQEDLLEALQLFLSDRAVRPRKFRKRFGNARGTNLLSYCEVRGFITKANGGRWLIDFGRVRDYRAQHAL